MKTTINGVECEGRLSFTDGVKRPDSVLFPHGEYTVELTPIKIDHEALARFAAVYSRAVRDALHVGRKLAEDACQELRKAHDDAWLHGYHSDPVADLQGLYGPGVGAPLSYGLDLASEPDETAITTHFIVSPGVAKMLRHLHTYAPRGKSIASVLLDEHMTARNVMLPAPARHGRASQRNGGQHDVPCGYDHNRRPRP